MPLVSQPVNSLVQGVSQQPHPLRLPSQSEEQKNCVDSVSDGKIKRPPTKHVAKLSSSPSGFTSAKIHTINRDASHRYRCVFLNGSLQIFDATGTSVGIVTPNGTDYLSTTNPAQDIRCATIGDTTVVINRSKTVAKASTKSPSAVPGVLVWVRQVDFGTLYQVTLAGIDATYVTPAGTSPDARSIISTDNIAIQIQAAIAALTELSAFTVTRYGSTLHITRTDGADFLCTTSDGLADTALMTVKDTIQNFEDLPARAPRGYVVEVTGDPTNTFDNYYVVYDDEDLSDTPGVWRECVKPGVLIGLDPSTMPHILQLGGDLNQSQDCAGIPPAPAIDAAGASPFAAPWNSIVDLLAVTSNSLPSAQSQIIHGNSSGVGAVSADIAFNGAPATVDVYFNVDASQAVFGVHMVLYAETTPGSGGVANLTGWTQVASVPFAAKATYSGQHIHASGSWAANTKLMLLCVHDAAAAIDGFVGGGTNVLIYNESSSAPNSLNAGIVVTTDLSQRIAFNPVDNYPVGVTVLLTLGGTNSDTFTHVIAADETGKDVADALFAHVNGLSTFSVTAISDGVIEIGPPSGAPTNSVTATVDLSMSAEVAYLPNGGFTTSAFVGETISNLTDGSTGTVTANGPDWIQVAGLTGGVSNAFSPGDSVVIVGSATSFTFKEATWNTRAAGDDDTVPFPSFIGKKINTVFGFDGRLIFTSQENIIASRAGDVFNFFRQSATNLLDDDMIDVSAASQKISFFYSVVAFREQLYLFSDQGQYILAGDPFLSPKTVALGLVTQYPSSTLAEPVNCGVRVFFSRVVGPSTRIMEYLRDWRTRENSANDITKQVPTYLLGNPVVLASDGSESFLAVLTDQNVVYVYSTYLDADSGQNLQQSWGKWTFDAGSTILSMDVVDYSMGLVIKRSDGVYLDTLDLNFSDTTPQAHVDRRWPLATGTLSSGNTTWTLPYSVATDGSAGEVVVVRQDTLAEITSTRPSATTVKAVGDFHTVPVYVGLRYTMYFKLSTIFMRKGQSSEAVTSGRLQLNYIRLSHSNTTKFSAVVTPQGRSAYTYPFVGPDITDLPGQFNIPLQARNLNLGIEISDSSVTDARFSGYDWEGRYTIRSKPA